MPSTAVTLGAALNASPLPHVLVEADRDPAGRVTDLRCTFANTAVADALGFDVTPIIGKPLGPLIAGFREKSVPRYAAILDAGRPGTLDLPSGSDIAGLGHVRGHFELRAVPLDAGRLIIAFRDIADRDETLQRLERSEAQLADAQRLGQFASWEIDIRSGLASGSPELYRLLRFPPRPFTREEYLARLHPEDRERVDHLLMGAVHDAKPFDVEYRILGPDGEERCHRIVVEAEVGPRGRPVRLYGSVLDLTAERERDRRLEESERHFRLLADNSGDWITRNAPDGVYLYSSPAARELFGYEPEELVGRRGFDLVHPDDLEAARVAHEQLLAGAPSALALMRFRAKDGRWVWIESRGRAVRGRDGALQEIHVTSRDVTERITTEESRRKAEQRFRTIFAQAAIPMALLDLEGRYLEVNDAYVELLGYPREGLAGLHMAEHTHPDDRARVLAEADAMRRGEKNGAVFEKRYIARDGAVVDVEIHAGIFTDADGSPAAFIGQVIDLRERRQAAQDHAIATTLQRSILPDRMPAIPGLALAARFAPGGEDVEVGGDWYDALPLPGGDLGVIVGDVVGRGLPAATVMGQLRNALRAYALEGHGPAAALDRLNHLVRALGREMMATVVFAVLSPSGRLRLASAGHPPPVIVGDDGAELVETGRGMPVAGIATARYEETECELPLGATLVLYTDGLVERRGESLDDGLARLSRALLSGPEAVEPLLDHVLARLTEGAEPDDDLALVAVRHVATGDRLDLELQASPEELAPVRRALERWLAEAGATDEETFDVLVASGEACANAIEHAYGPAGGPIRLLATREGRTVTLTVSDTGSWRAPRGRHRGRGLPIMKALMDEVEVQRAAAGTELVLRRRLGGIAA